MEKHLTAHADCEVHNLAAATVKMEASLAKAAVADKRLWR
jgi:hypothetical protein